VNFAKPFGQFTDKERTNSRER